VIFGLMFIAFPQRSSAWKNGKTNAKTVARWISDYNSGTYDHYGTHQFIAHKVYDETIGGWFTVNDRQFHNERTFTFFMLGNEAPDYGIRTIEVLADEECGGIYLSPQICNFSRDHRCWVDDIENPIIKSGLVKGARGAYMQTLYHLRLGHCEAAAYCMGALQHYISDAVCFPHVISLKMTHTAYEQHVLQYTNKPYYDCTKFNLNLHGYIGFGKHPEECVIEAARETYYGTFLGGTGENAKWMYDFWNAIDHYGEEDNFDTTVEVNLNCGVYYGCMALKWIKNQFPEGIDCSCETAVSDSIREEILEALTRVSVECAENLEFLVAYAIVGKTTSIFALFLVGKESITKKEVLQVITIKY